MINSEKALAQIREQTTLPPSMHGCFGGEPLCVGYDGVTVAEFQRAEDAQVYVEICGRQRKTRALLEALLVEHECRQRYERDWRSAENSGLLALCMDAVERALAAFAGEEERT